MVLKIAFSTNAQSRFSSVVVEGFLGPEVFEGAFFQTDIEYETVALSKPEIEVRPRRGFFSSFLGHFEEKTRNSLDISPFSRHMSRLRPDFDLARDRGETEARNFY